MFMFDNEIFDNLIFDVGDIVTEVFGSSASKSKRDAERMARKRRLEKIRRDDDELVLICYAFINGGFANGNR